jgi:hypothetical protein
MIPLTYFISVDQVPSRKLNLALLYGGIGIAHGGGTRSCRFARRWRYLIFGSASHLRLCLVSLCTRGTPVENVLAHSPLLPLIIDYNYENHDLTPEDEEGILLALQHRDRMCRIALWMPVPSLHKLVTAIDDEFPVLEFLDIVPSAKHNTCSILPSTLEPRHPRHL